MELAKYKACICEGSAENAIMDILLDNNLLIFSREEMLEEEVIRCREGKRFEEKYLRKGFMDKISVIRILDSRRENFKISKAYEHKVDVINVITAPEIEMLIIFNRKETERILQGRFKNDWCKGIQFCERVLRRSQCSCSCNKEVSRNVKDPKGRVYPIGFTEKLKKASLKIHITGLRELREYGTGVFRGSI